MFRGIYRPYKNYQPRLMTPPDEKSALMQEVNKYAFAAHDILLYLDNFPNDQEAINLYNRFMESYVRARDAYEERYGAITTSSATLGSAPFSWTVGGWPWVGRCRMFRYEKRLMFPVKIRKRDLKMVNTIITQYRGPDGELAAALRYLNQRYSMPDDHGRALLTDIGTEELSRRNGRDHGPSIDGGASIEEIKERSRETLRTAGI